MSLKKNDIQYRPEIDGLRAIAVLSVIFYHGQINFFNHNIFSGGFLGVDIFFVISGYLISSIIMREIIDKKSFSFKYFYERRIRRILPALFFVMLISYVFAWHYLLPASFIDFSRSTLSSLIFSSNFYFWVEAREYAAELSLLKPLLHTWSLSVEEQFYIVFPFIVLFLFKFFKKNIFSILLTMFLMSLLFSEIYSFIYPSLNFYILPSRGWELLSGAIIAYLQLKYGRNNQTSYSNFLVTIGLIIIFISLLLFDDSMRLPSSITLMPVCGTLMIIYFANKKDFITKILSTKPFVGVGLISYSLYLWHFPIMAFSRVNNISPAEIDKYKWILLTFILSIASYFFIEKPFRNKKKITVKTLAISLSALFVFLISINFYTIRSKGFSESLAWMLQKEFVNIEPKGKLKDKNGNECHGVIMLADSCIFNKRSEKKIFLVGDSHVASFMYEFKEKAIKENYQLLTRTSGGCIYLPDFIRKQFFNKDKKKLSKECNYKYLNDLRTELLSNPQSIVIIGGRLPLYISGNYFDNKEGGIERVDINFEYTHYKNKYSWQEGFKKSIKELTYNGNKVILLYPIPEVGLNVAYALFKDMPIRDLAGNQKNFLVKNRITTSYDVYKDRSKKSFKLLDSIKGKNIYRVYPHQLFCNKEFTGRCITHNEKEVFYYDDDHLSGKGAEKITDLIFNKIQIIDLNKN